MAFRWLAALAVLLAISVIVPGPDAQTPSNPAQPPPPNNNTAPGGDLTHVEKLLALRRDYQKSLETLRAHYFKVGDLERMRWAEEELIAFHRAPKHAFILSLDVPPPNLTGNTNIIEANKMYMWALSFNDKGWGTDYQDNQRRSEILFQEILTKYPHSDKISDVAFMLGDIYESKAYKQPRRAAAYYERCYQWNPKTTHEARIRAARLYDRTLNDRAKALELYREVLTHETEPRRHQEAEKRLKELSGTR